MTDTVVDIPRNHRVILVDDDASVRDALSWLLRTRRLLTQGYASGDDFLQDPCWQAPPSEATCVLLDVRMPGLSGLVVFDRWLAQPWAHLVPIIFLSGHADIATAVDAVKRGAFDFCEKPFSDNALVDRVERALMRSAQGVQQQAQTQQLQKLLDHLTDREREVMERIVAGMPNKLVADELNISVRTVEVHRARVFDKMGVRSAVELTNKLRGG